MMRLLLSFSNTTSCMVCSHGSWMVMWHAECKKGKLHTIASFQYVFPYSFCSSDAVCSVATCWYANYVQLADVNGWGCGLLSIGHLSGVRGSLCSFLLSMQVWHHSGASFRSAVLESVRTKPSVARCYTLAVVTKVKITFTRMSWRLTVRMGPSLTCW